METLIYECTSASVQFCFTSECLDTWKNSFPNQGFVWLGFFEIGSYCKLPSNVSPILPQPLECQDYMLYLTFQFNLSNIYVMFLLRECLKKRQCLDYLVSLFIFERQSFTMQAWLAWNTEIHLPLSFDYWDQRCVSLCLALFAFLQLTNCFILNNEKKYICMCEISLCFSLTVEIFGKFLIITVNKTVQQQIALILHIIFI